MIANILRMTVLLLALGIAAGCAGEGGGEGPEGSGEGGSEHGGPGGSEGPEGGATGTNPPFVSTGISRGTFESIPLAPDESFAGLLHDTEVAVFYNPVLESFIGRIRNEAPEAVCDVEVTVTLDGFRTVNASFSGQPFVLDGLAQFQRARFEFPAPGASFSNWTIATNTSMCSSAPGPVANSGEGGEGSGGEGSGEHGGSGGGEGGGEHGGSGEGSGGGEGGGGHGGSGEGSEGGGESGDEASPPIPINQPFSGTIGNQAFSFAYDPLHGVFRGTVENPAAAFVCDSRTEMHLGYGGAVIELGPTIPVNLPPGGTIRIVMSAGGFVLDTYTLHPESTPCP